MIFPQFGQSGTNWLSYGYNPDVDLSQYTHKAGYFGPRFKDRRPPGLYRISETQLVLDAQNRGEPAFVVPPCLTREVSEQILDAELARLSLGDTFVSMIRVMAAKESGALLNRPADIFNTLPRGKRGGKRFITAYGMFQWNRDAWRAELMKYYKAAGQSTQSNVKTMMSVDKNPYLSPIPYDQWGVTHQITLPVAKYAELYHSMERSFGAFWSVVGVNLWQHTPAAFNTWKANAQRRSPSVAWEGVTYQRKDAVFKHASKVVNV